MMKNNQSVTRSAPDRSKDTVTKDGQMEDIEKRRPSMSREERGNFKLVRGPKRRVADIDPAIVNVPDQERSCMDVSINGIPCTQVADSLNA
ncbi:unnamed protein product [Cylicocyclus nassatus]|uniref:Uncharacterized protein n=1 Tax=Cylicocyclus nassatus TaxID=53992 RepID=A0AA36GGM2_CYLNA|nr:unnamed protein product [Cylicocyclus nassatus]